MQQLKAEKKPKMKCDVELRGCVPIVPWFSTRVLTGVGGWWGDPIPLLAMGVSVHP